MQTVKLKAPAKVNLYLNVLRKRPDGFHDIETVFEKINLCDEIVLKRRKQGIRILCTHKDLPSNGRNLGFKAAEALLAKTKRQDGVEIKITKRIPVAAGLGGGSSDAAAVLLGLNRLLRLGQTRTQLLQVAAQLGADVPFFVLRSLRAIGRGKGEALTPLKIKRKNWYVLVVPPLAVSTRRMYQALRITLTKPHPGVKIVIRALESDNLTSLNKCSYNSFEPVLQKKYQEIQEIKKALRSLGAYATLVSGSGPCVFGITQTRKEAMGISKKLETKEKNWQIIVAKTYDSKK